MRNKSHLEKPITGAHTQNTDTKLDEGGANEILVTEIPKMATANVTYYVATDGDDSKSGTDAEPFATVQHAIDLIPKILNGYYAIILLKDGTYNENVTISNFINGEILFFSNSYDADSVLIEAPVNEPVGFYVDQNSAYIYISDISVKIQENYGRCFMCSNSTYVDIENIKVGDNNNTETIGIYNMGSRVSLGIVADIDANKVSTGIKANWGGTVFLYAPTPFGETYTDSSVGGFITDGIHLSKADYDDAITKKHTQGEDTALGAQSENLDMNTHKIINVVDPIDDQDAITKLFASNMAINGGAF